MLNGCTDNVTGRSTVDWLLAVVNVMLPDAPLVTPERFGVSVNVAGVVPAPLLDRPEIASQENGFVTVKPTALPSLLFTETVCGDGAGRP